MRVTPMCSSASSRCRRWRRSTTPALERRGNAISHVRKIVALAEIHGDEPVVRAITDALAFEAFSSEYVAHLIEARERKLPEASPLVLMRRQDALDLELPPADLSAYANLTGDDDGND